MHVKNLISAIKEIMQWYKSKFNRKLILTMAPETTYVQGGLSNWSVKNICGGAYLALIEQLRDEIDLLMVQLYNSGSILDLNGKETFEKSIDFPISATETVIKGFTAKGGLGKYSGLPEEKIVVGLTTCKNDEAYFNKSEIKSIMRYLLGSGNKPGSYTLKNKYPNLRGLMTWSINTDAKMSSQSSCNPVVKYEFAQAFEEIFGLINNGLGEMKIKKLNIFPNPASDRVIIDTKELIGKFITISDFNGRIIKNLLVNKTNTIININKLSNGFYIVKSTAFVGKIIVKN